MGVSFNISRQGKRYMPNDAVYVRVCPCMRVCVCNTPSRENTVHDTVGVYKSTKYHILVFWRLKYEMINW